jgi:hypothetical protein
VNPATGTRVPAYMSDDLIIQWADTTNAVAQALRGHMAGRTGSIRDITVALKQHMQSVE